MSTHRLSQTQLGEYIEQAYLLNPQHQATHAKRLESLYGANSIYPIFGKGEKTDEKIIAHIRKREPDYQESPYVREGQYATPKASIPWGQGTRNTAGQQYDHSLVGRTVEIASPEDIAEFDPRYLHGTQPSITAPGVLHYLEGGQNSPLYADQHNIGNQYPFVYIHRPTGEMRLLGGHHRATSALLKGEPLVARYAIGDY